MSRLEDLATGKTTIEQDIAKQQADRNKPLLCLDFDGVIHSYTSGWKGAAVIPDPPVPGALQLLEADDANSGLTLELIQEVQRLRDLLTAHGISPAKPNATNQRPN